MEIENENGHCKGNENLEYKSKYQKMDMEV